MANPFKGLGGNKGLGGLGDMGGLGGLGNLSKLLETTQKKMLEDAENMQTMLDETRIEGTAGGVVKAVVDGHGTLISLTLGKEAVDPNDVNTLQELILKAIENAQTQAADMREKEQAKLMESMPQIPGMPKLPF
jgi:nucleoid-associated protein EbfC